MRIALVAALSILCGGGVQAQGGDREHGRLVVFVRDAETRMPFEGARVDVLGTVAATGKAGRILFSGLEGLAQVRVSATGRAEVDTTVAVGADSITRVDVYLSLSTTQIEGVLVESESLNDVMLRRRGFFDRRELRSGKFITRNELDARGATQFIDVFSGVSGVRIAQRGGATVLVSDRRRDCPMAVFIDGVEAAFLSEQIDNVPFDPIAAVEIYRGPADMPQQYAYTKQNRTCGAVLVWTQIDVE
ncbi:TonB-dependent receptor plug domain-containing protein [Rubrivirga sp. S365]|uniref:TonB-dependent receptor plug domain-containing protein n=1 Tax=Rubrivirga litoralis TaxID=3075598 RepID=A0ABU3BU59_9BACT|nr:MULTISPECIES: TonB-dependent receptor plug domain-containing protein [unclassified Rubrivirga]MDT0632834.1 TonB-dependent receptor plug domain-containing protein [Rubrivirga sp. F394]MDT7855112.1 TonB-dependent receptor plug domain-containing protein [Rubrivirga sp. S365]